MSKLSRYWKENPEWVWAAAFFTLLMVHGALIGLTDDEAYYWVLAQKPALGYAFHPPAVAWSIALSQKLAGWLLGTHSVAMVRLPAAFCASAVFGMALHWLRKVGTPVRKVSAAALVLLSLAGLFSLSWMMVPDLPLLLGWMVTFAATWEAIDGAPGTGTWIALGLGTCLTVLSKYSGILVPFSAMLALLIWAEPGKRNKGWFAVIAGGILALIPIVVWNAMHGWGSILYQIHDRQQGSLSLARYGRFWAVEAFAAGPVFLVFVFASIREIFRSGSRESRVWRYLWVWAGPAALVFGIQPIWADFKPHWAFIAWWPLMIALAWASTACGKWVGWAKAQAWYGLTLGALVILSCHVPIGDWVLSAVAGEHADPRLDVTNDLYGWSGLAGFLRAQPGDEDLSVPVVGSRYQTAAQAYFALGPKGIATLLPRDLKARDEWPDLKVADSTGPKWPRLLRSVYFVADNRYDSPPGFQGAQCAKIGRVEGNRGRFLAKWIEVWKCVPTR